MEKKNKYITQGYPLLQRLNNEHDWRCKHTVLIHGLEEIRNGRGKKTDKKTKKKEIKAMIREQMSSKHASCP